MSIRPCHLCKRRADGKLASAYWAWFLADGERVAWRQRLCMPCLTSTFLTVLQTSKSASMEEPTCPVCGGSSEHDSDPVFLVLYLPKQDPREFELNTDAACAAKIRGNIFELGERLANRQAQVRGPSPDDGDPWAELEL